MNKVLRITVYAAFLAFGVSGAASAQQKSEVTRTSPNHTKIVIQDSSPESRKTREERVRRAEDRKERAKDRAHEIELARIRAGTDRQPARRVEEIPQRQSSALPSIAERRKIQNELNQPSAFMNGGQWTGIVGGGFWGPGFWGPGFGPGFVNAGFGPGFVGPGFNQGFRRGCAPVARNNFRRGPSYRRGCR